MVLSRTVSQAFRQALTAAALASALLLSGANAHGLTLEEAVRKAWAAAPQLEAQREQWRLSSLDRWRRFIPNEPQLLYSNADDRTNVGWGAAETFSFPGKSLAYSAFDRARESSQRAEWRAKRYEVARNAAQAYIDSAVAAAAVDLQKKSIADLEALSQTLRARYEAGLATQAEDISAELQLRQVRADLTALSDHLATATRRLAKLLGLPDAAAPDLELSDDLSPALAADLGGHGADLLRAEAAAEIAAAGKGLAWWNQLPDISVTALRNRYYYLPGSPNGSAQTWTYGASATIPILFPFWEWAEASRARSQAVLDESAAKLSALAADSDVDDAARDYARSRSRLADVRRQDLPLAEALMESTLSSYKTGKLGFAELVLARKALSDVRAQDIQLRGEILSARLRCLDQCIPTPPFSESKP